MRTEEYINSKGLYILKLANDIYNALDNEPDAKRPIPANTPHATAEAAARIAARRREAEELAQKLRDDIGKVELPKYNDSDAIYAAYIRKTALKEEAARALEKAVQAIDSNAHESAESMCETLKQLQEKPEHEREPIKEEYGEPVPLSDAHKSQFNEIFSEIIALLERHGEEAAPPPPPPPPPPDGDGVGKLEHTYPKPRSF